MALQKSSKEDDRDARIRRMLLEDAKLGDLPQGARAGLPALLLGVEAVQKLRGGEWAAARRLFIAAVDADPKDAESLFNMGVYWDVAHVPQKMVRWMDAVIDLLPGHIGAWVLKSKFLEHEARYEEALEGYATVLRLDPSHKLAAGQLAGILGNRQVSLDPVSASPEVLAALPPLSSQLPEWQENFLRPVPSRPLWQPLLQDGVMAWDDALSEELLRRLDASVDHYFQYVFSNGWVCCSGTGVGNATTCWLPTSEPVATAPELAARYLLRRLVREDTEDFVGIEFWGRVRSADLGAALHYDQAEADKDVHGTWVHGNPWRPRWSSVLYLTDEGGPTVVTEQVHLRSGRHVPALPARGHCVMPRRNRWMVFRGDLFHGTLPIERCTRRMRKVFIFNYWQRHTPAAPHCQKVDYERHEAMQPLQLSPDAIHQVHKAEAALPAPKALRRTTFHLTSMCSHSSTLGYLPQALPFPGADLLKQSSGLCQFNWGQPADYEAVD